MDFRFYTLDIRAHPDLCFYLEKIDQIFYDSHVQVNKALPFSTIESIQHDFMVLVIPGISIVHVDQVAMQVPPVVFLMPLVIYRDIRYRRPFFDHWHCKPIKPFRTIIPYAVAVMEVIFDELSLIENDEKIDRSHLFYEPEIRPMVRLVHSDLYIYAS
jgi:hypothetical protein